MESFESVIIMSEAENGCKPINWKDKNGIK